MPVFRQRRSHPARTLETLVAQTLTAQTAQVRALMQHLPQACVATVMTPLLHRLTAFCWDLPASEAHHHGRPFGLLTHSLEVATHALVTFTQSSLWWQKAPDPAERHRMQPHWRLGTACAGLLHDLGKVFDVTVQLAGHDDMPPPCWDPFVEPLLAFVLRHQGHDTLPPLQVHWHPGRGMRHEAASALAATLLLDRTDLQALTLPVARELWAYLGGHPDPANLFRQLLTRAPGPGSTLPADGHSVQTDLQTLPPAQPALAAQVLATLAQCCREGPLRVNQFPGQVFVQAEETLVVVPEAFKAVRARLTQQGVTLPGGGVLYNDLAAAGYVCGEAGRNVTAAEFRRPGKPPVTLAVLRVPNAVLWGATSPAAFGGELVMASQTATTTTDAA
jgi:hypothetical protein